MQSPPIVSNLIQIHAVLKSGKVPTPHTIWKGRQMLKHVCHQEPLDVEDLKYSMLF